MEAEHFLTKNMDTEDTGKKQDPQDKKSTDRYVQADIATSFVILVGVFFPSVTGIMAGSNRSGNLRDASRSIPLGTISATTLTSIVYLLGTIMIAASVDEMFIRDKFGQSAFSALVVAELAVPHPMVVYVGSLIATTGAGMQSLT
uniref:Amino acid permease/ SLC12A domain-containing protein n=1 Tax=Romanomermis culicivorax TaxID=13658 RepID=A0A915L7E7_ROMCU